MPSMPRWRRRAPMPSTATSRRSAGSSPIAIRSGRVRRYRRHRRQGGGRDPSKCSCLNNPSCGRNSRSRRMSLVGGIPIAAEQGLNHQVDAMPPSSHSASGIFAPPGDFIHDPICLRQWHAHRQAHRRDRHAAVFARYAAGRFDRFDRKIETLLGQYNMAVAAGGGEFKITGKAKFARLQATQINNLFLGQTLTANSMLEMTTGRPISSPRERSPSPITRPSSRITASSMPRPARSSCRSPPRRRGPIQRKRRRLQLQFRPITAPRC